MKQYTVIPKEIAEYKSNSKLSDIYAFACIRSTIDYQTGISKYNQETLSKKFNIPERTLRDAIYRLEKQKLLIVTQTIYKKETNDK